MNKKIATIFILLSLLLVFIIVITFNSEIKSNNNIISLEEIINVNFIVSIEKIDILTETEKEYYMDFIENSETIITNSFVNYNIKYKSGEYEVTGMISAPEDYMSNKYPILIHNRGGSGDYSVENFGIIQAYAARGFIVFASNYRGVNGGTGKDEFCGKDIEDVEKLLSLAEKVSFGNGKIYMDGSSRGGATTYVMLKLNSNRIDAACSFAGFSDLKQFFYDSPLIKKQRIVRFVGGTPTQISEEYKERSAIYWANKISAPLLIIHGDSDEVVNIEHSKVLYESLKNLNKNVELVVLENYGHYYSSELFDIISKWLLDN